MATRHLGGTQQATTFAGGTRTKIAIPSPSHTKYCTLSSQHQEINVVTFSEAGAFLEAMDYISRRALQISPADWPEPGVHLLCLLKVRCWEETGLFSAAVSFVLPPGVFQLLMQELRFEGVVWGFFTLQWRALPLVSHLLVVLMENFKLSL